MEKFAIGDRVMYAPAAGVISRRRGTVTRLCALSVPAVAVRWDDGLYNDNVILAANVVHAAEDSQ